MDPFDLAGLPGDPFAPTPPPAAAGAPPATPQAAGGAPAEPRFVTEAQYNELKGQYDSLKPLENLRWIGEALADPTTATRVRQAIFTAGAGAPPTAGAPAAPPVDPTLAIKARYQGEIESLMRDGKMSEAMSKSAEMGAELAKASFMPEMASAAAPLITMTAQNTIEGFYNNKRVSSPLFAKIEAQVRAYVNQTPPATVAQLAQSGQLVAALETAYNTVLAQTYETSYNKAVSDGRIAAASAPGTPPPYAAGTGGGGPIMGTPDTPTDDDKNDAEFVAWAKERGIDFTGSANGRVIVGELK
jgi:hypothetical protein